MHDIATQMVMKWARKGHEDKILLTDDFTRLTLDTIALCAMDYRFNSFYSETLDPYVTAMNNMLHARSTRNQIGSILKSLLPSSGKQIQKDIAYMSDVGNQLVQFRRQNPTDKRDLLNAMINGKDPKTGQVMDDGLIAANMQTFLIAGELLSRPRHTYLDVPRKYEAFQVVYGILINIFLQAMRQRLDFFPLPSCTCCSTRRPTSPPSRR
jgi:cytochrome P450/NADPH-cytochrome P450 reductase